MCIRDRVRAPANAWVASGGRGNPKNPEEKFASAQHQQPGSEGLDPSPSGKRTSKDRRAAKKQKVQADKDELKRLRAASAGSGAKGGGKASGKDSGLKAKDQTGTDLCFSWDSGKGTCGDCAPGAACLAKVKRAHKCRVCLSPGHRSAECPQRS